MTYAAKTRQTAVEAIRARLSTLYGDERADSALDRLLALLPAAGAAESDAAVALTERDAVLISYGDQVRRAGEAPLVTLRTVLEQITGPIDALHILPFYPYSSDDGFSVIDYEQVDPALGSWADVQALGRRYRLMFDAVFNHISAQSAWFQNYLTGDPRYADYFIALDPATDVSLVTRPRALPLLTPFETSVGQQHLWTTFSDDQIDLNAANPDVLVELIRILLFYVEQGAQLIRLDAIGFLWKQVGTVCIHLPETHLIIQLMRDVLDLAAPRTILVTETNVPHLENIRYFGHGNDEAQMVYQFPLPPLILHTLRSGDATALSRWAATIERVSDRTTFFNFAASHDGIGIRPVTGILNDDEIAALVALTKAHGGNVSYKVNSDGSQSPYELNITYFDAITDPRLTAERPDLAVSRFIVSQAIMLAFLGVPGIYFHSLVGSRNDEVGLAQTGRYRSINREKLDADALVVALADANSLRAQVYRRYTELLTLRTNEAAFDPLGFQAVLNLNRSVFAIERQSRDRTSRVIALHNVSGTVLDLSVPTGPAAQWVNLIDRRSYQAANGRVHLTLRPYEVAWFKAF